MYVHMQMYVCYTILNIIRLLIESVLKEKTVYKIMSVYIYKYVRTFEI